MTQEALKLALDALKESKTNNDTMEFHDRKNKAITAIEEALAQTQEPVAHLWECIGRWSAYLVNNGKQADCAPPSWLFDAVNNAITPPQRTEQNFCSRCGKRTADLTTIHTCTPPQE
jgi:hypothetical protein